ncbi:DUF1254 domain-containing protein [Agrobacterium vitis]|uniref:DUF1254 domain-containing protein n=1 Tax=Agrobacterium vitis TaxID=373 RepID=A0AAE2RDX1_AGRVI|nr:DUF1254 domain-containing protein [Agrobacterium vitis]MBF2716740.1 DUF1254 domain-containing protein [Agrobacterium vitis]MUZ63966.1 DUF1254 domain-containing protein [Agrobacterium vitis]MVA19901.1 DUF1254 domain-containing protein [Agrobacterium vitis]
MRKLIYAIVVGLVGAVVLHIVIILALPHFTGKDAYTRVTMEGPLFKFYSLDSRADRAGLANGDPFLKLAACAFDVSEAPVHLTAEGSVPFWSVGIFDRDANEVYSMNDATSVEGKLDIIVATPAQLARLRATAPDALAQTILVEMPETQGYAVLRTLVPQASFAPDAQAFLTNAGCDQTAIDP